ncbi:hypothetical protein QNA23_10725 [Rhodococcus erythropolis]|uniref:hypothetical protein n=1 Tax=Rhodococcus erythropolis TaxID=1833 RepID=UPI0024B94722|nr:hypothetical protein [Rhodococcus erythropolis]MDJ0403956.1 hypothetical protein [Rhodococcus erythropolis]
MKAITKLHARALAAEAAMSPEELRASKTRRALTLTRHAVNTPPRFFTPLAQGYLDIAERENPQLHRLYLDRLATLRP